MSGGSRPPDRPTGPDGDEIRLPAGIWSTEIGFWEWTPQTDRLTWLNDWPRRVGIPPCAGDAHVPQLYSVMDPDHVGRIATAWHEHASGRRDRYEVEYRVRASDGQWRWLAMRARIVERGSAGEPLRMLGAAFDIDERRRLESQLAETHARFAAAVALIPAWILLVDPDSKITYSSRGDHGLAADQLCGRRVEDVNGLRMLEAFPEHCGRALATGANLEYRCATRDGRDMEVRFALVRSGPGVSGVAVSITDVTQRAARERSVLRAEAEARHRLSERLHEDLSQTLAGIAYSVSSIRRAARAEDSSMAASLDRVLESLSAAVATTRALARRATPFPDGSRGLAMALEALGPGLDPPAAVRCWLDPALGPAIDGVMAEHVFALAQASIMQAVRTRRARNVRVVIERRTDEACLAVSDDGSVEVHAPDDGAEIHAIRDRVEQLRARIVVSRTAAGGIQAEYSWSLWNRANET